MSPARGYLDSHEGIGFTILEVPKLHFLGRASVSTIGPQRVAALSGIEVANTFHLPHPHISLLPYKSNNFNFDDIKSISAQANDGNRSSNSSGGGVKQQSTRRLLQDELGIPQRGVDRILTVLARSAGVVVVAAVKHLPLSVHYCGSPMKT